MIPDELVDAFVQAAWGTDDPPALEALKRRDARRGLEAIFASVDVLDLLVQAGLAPDTLAGLAQENDDLHADLVKALHVRNLALEEAATDFQHGGDGQDYIDRGRMIRRWLEVAYENYDAGETTTHPPSSFAPKDGTP